MAGRSRCASLPRAASLFGCSFLESFDGYTDGVADDAAMDGASDAIALDTKHDLDGDLEGDANHCTSCTTICIDSNTCRGLLHESSGYCCVLNTYGCPTGTTACPSDRGDYSCFSLQTDPTHCGSCSASAPCVCPGGFTNCPKSPGGTDLSCVEGSACP